VGAVALQQATWAIPRGDRFDEGVDRAMELVTRGGGRPLLFEVTPSDQASAALEELFTAEREAEWVEFVSECAKCETELHSEFDKEKFTLAELDEEEHNLERLRRWYRELRGKDVFGAPTAPVAEQALKQCGEVLEAFAERVFQVRERP
jgi:hypothetical protein